MAKIIGWQEVTSGERASETFLPRSGEIIVGISGASSTPDWHVQQQLPNDEWKNVSADEIDSGVPIRTFTVASHVPTRLYGDTSTDSDYADVLYYWANRLTATESLLLA